VPDGAAERVEALLPEVGVGELELPDEVARSGPEEGLEALRRRLDAVEGELAALSRERAELAAARLGALHEARAACHDRLLPWTLGGTPGRPATSSCSRAGCPRAHARRSSACCSTAQPGAC
jgi:hypothetical protein